MTHPPTHSATAQLEQRLGATQVELRKLGSERHTLRARLRREADRVQELESALRAEKDLRRQATEEHQAALNGLRARLADVEAEKSTELGWLTTELEQNRVELTQQRTELEACRAELLQSRAAAPALAARGVKPPQGLRRIRGIGPAYQRVLEHEDVTRVQQVAAWTEANIAFFAEKLRIRPDRIQKEDWVGQAKLLEADPED